MPARPSSSDSSAPTARVLAYNRLGTALTYVLSRFSSGANRSFLWRLAAAFTFREIKGQHVNGTKSAKPYIRFERFFAQNEVYLERFQNLVIGDGIFIDLLKSDWFLTLPIKDRITVTSLFRRIENSKNLSLILSRRHTALENLESLKNLDQDSLPPSLFIKEETEHTALESVFFSIRKALTLGPSRAMDFVNRIFGKTVFGLKSGIGLIIGLFLMILTLPFTLLGLAGVKGGLMTAARSATARKKLALQIGLKNAPHAISNSLRKYEMAYGHDENAVKALATQFETSNTKSILNKSWLESIPLEHRVFVTSILRKVANISTSKPIFASILPVITSKNQRDITQITGVSPEQHEELRLFKSIQNTQQKQTPEKASNAPTRPLKATSEFLNLASEDILRRQGWTSQFLNGLDLTDAIRFRSIRDVLKITSSEDSGLPLPTHLKEQLASFSALLGEPIKTSNPNFKDVDTKLKASAKTLQSPTHMARLTDRARSSVLPFDTTEGLTIRRIWLRIANAGDDQVAFSEATETLIAAYDAQPITRVSKRSVSFDTFLIHDLEVLLGRMKIWIDWDLCGRSSLIAFAHLAGLANDNKLFETAFDYIESQRGIPKALVESLRNSFLSVGIHKVHSVINGMSDNVEPLEALDPKKKYLCLVEGGAGIRAIRKLEGLSENIVCGPVIPTDAPRYPEEATLKYIDDYIPKYSKRDMELAFEVDELAETYIQKTTELIRGTGVNERYAEAVEVAHATMFFGMYQEALAIEVSETLLKDAKNFDSIIFLMNSGNVLGSLLPEALKAFGQENVYVGLENNRSKDFGLAIKNIRKAVKKPSTSPVKPSVQNDDWTPAFAKWLSTTMNTHEKSVVTLPEEDYALLTLEHVNGYYDSYLALTHKSLEHMDVELFTSIANPAFNDYISEGGFEEKKHNLTQCALNNRPSPARDWMPGLVTALKETFDDVNSPWFPKHQNMMQLRAETMLANRLPQILDAVSYFRARFSHNQPKYVFTGPNQHTISRVASYAALAQDIPVYDFLILASTHHPRYRHPVAKYAYIYDPWYRDIFENYMRMPADKIRVSGPLFDYGQRLKKNPKRDKQLKNKTHIVFFSQSGNFQNSCNMLEGICKGSKSYDDIFITVKMHPHESPANLKHYETFAAKHGVTDNINLIHHGDAAALINDADLVVQSFSNVGLDALLMKTPVITFKPPSNLKARIFLYEKDIGHVVKTKAALATKIRKFLSDPEDKIRMQAMAEKFALENEHFLRSDNAERVMKEVLVDIGKTA